MTPTQARAFLAVALKGSFSAAARSLRVSQPTVTNQVKQIERQYDVELFHRGGRGASLTPAGEALLPHIRTMFNSFEEASTFLDDLRGKRGGHLHIGSYGPYDVMKIVGHYRQRFPSVTLSVDFANSERLAEKLLNYELDVAVLGQIKRQPKFYTLPFSRPPLVVIAPRNSAWTGRQSVAAADLKNEVVVRREPGAAARDGHDRFFRTVDIPSAQMHQFGSREGVINAVAEGVGIGTIFDEGVLPEGRVVKLKIAGPPILSKVDVVCLTNRRTNSLISGFFDIAQEILSETGTAKGGTVAPRGHAATGASRVPAQTAGKRRRAPSRESP
jgi:LysR family transcriptional regulator, low CO2-responsive transcriptional regulator